MRQSSFLRRAPAAFMLLAAGCAELHWVRAGTDDPTLRRDLDSCRQQAAFQARSTVPPPAPLSSMVTDQHGRVAVAHQRTDETERLLLENDLTAACMRERGYRREPK